MDDMKKITLTNEPNQEITTKIGEKLDIVLASNPTTGFNWYIKEGLEDETQLKCLNLNEYKSGDYESGNHTPGLCGGGGFTHFHFEPVSTGTHQVKLVYIRPWLENNPASQIYLKFIVQ